MRKASWAAALAALAVAGGVWFVRSEAPSVETAPAVVAAPAAPTTANKADASRNEVAAAPAISAAPAGSPADTYDPEQDDGTIAFASDAQGRLITNEKARLDLERLHALYTPAERARKLQEVSATLPPEAAAQLYRLMDQYVNYQAAAFQAYPPDRAMTTVEQGVSQVDGMHGLRVQFFGEEATRGMFAREEQMQREMFALMDNERDQSLTMEQRAERAQRLYREHGAQ